MMNAVYFKISKEAKKIPLFLPSDDSKYDKKIPKMGDFWMQ